MSTQTVSMGTDAARSPPFDVKHTSSQAINCRLTYKEKKTYSTADIMNKTGEKNISRTAAKQSNICFEEQIILIKVERRSSPL